MRRYLLSIVISVLIAFGFSAVSLAEPVTQTALESPAIASDLSPQDIEAIAKLRQQAFTATSTGEFAQAEIYWSKLLDLLPENPALWSNRGNVRLSQNKLDAAIADYDQAIAIAPDAPDPYLNRGAAYEGLGRWQAAIADYNTVLSLEPNDVAAYNNRGNAQGGLGNWDAALADYQTAADLAPSFALARVNVGLAQYQTGQTDDAIRTFRNLVRKYRDFADARAALTAVLWVDGQRGEAESHWVAATGLDGRYRDLNWVRTIRRWPPAMVEALDQFLHL
ncbi:MAG: tetratricopeptide repeat protein [Cyanobacteria bacterium P01_A01_bin.123]